MSNPPEGWTRCTIGSLCKLLNGRAFKPTDWTDTGLPIVRIQNLNNHEAPFNRFNGEVRHRFLIDSGALLFARSGTPGTSFGSHIWNRGPAVLNQHIFNVIFDETKIDKDFFRFAINQKLDELIDKAHGGVGLRHVTKGKFEATEIDLPPLDDQRILVAKIDSLLKRLEAAKADLDRIPRLIERYKQAIRAVAFSEALREATHCPTLGEIVTEMKNGLSRKPVQAPPGVPILRISAVRPGRVNLADRRFFVTAKNESLVNYELKNGDLLFTRYNGNAALVAVCGVVRDLEETILYPDKLIRVRLKPDARAEFVEMLMASTQMRAKLSPHIKTAAGQHGISGKDLKSVSIPLPPLPVQERILGRVTSHMAQISATELEATRATQLFDRLDHATLAKAFRGELVPSKVPSKSIEKRSRPNDPSQNRDLTNGQ
jgi:type I restriction enzyme S subunit